MYIAQEGNVIKTQVGGRSNMILHLFHDDSRVGTSLSCTGYWKAVPWVCLASAHFLTHCTVVAAFLTHLLVDCGLQGKECAFLFCTHRN